MLCRHCDPFNQPELCLVPETLSGSIGVQSPRLIISANANRIAFPPYQVVWVWQLHTDQPGLANVCGAAFKLTICWLTPRRFCPLASGSLREFLILGTHKFRATT